MRKRWWLMVRDANGRVIHERAFRTRRGAVRYGAQVSTPPLNTFEVVALSDVLHFDGSGGAREAAVDMQDNIADGNALMGDHQ